MSGYSFRRRVATIGNPLPRSSEIVNGLNAASLSKKYELRYHVRSRSFQSTSLGDLYLDLELVSIYSPYPNSHQSSRLNALRSKFIRQCSVIPVVIFIPYSRSSPIKHASHNVHLATLVGITYPSLQNNLHPSTVRTASSPQKSYMLTSIMVPIDR